MSYAYDTVKRLSRKNDLEAMARIVDKAAKLYHTYDKMIPMLSKIFLGVEESNPLTIYHAATANKCAAIGREPIDCPSNSPNEVFWDRGFNPDFQDTHNQVFHFWAYVATAASTDMKVGGFALGFYVGQGANIFHEILGYGDPAGASWQDFALAQAGMNTGEMIAFGLIPPNQLGNYIRDNIGNKGAPYVDTLKEFVPLPIWPFNYLAK